MAAAASSSTHWRKQGNSIYTTATDSLSPVLRKERLTNALRCYNKAFDLSRDVMEKSSAAKNVGMASWKLGNVLVQREEKMALMLHYFKDALKHFSIAHLTGECRPQDWKQNIVTSMQKCFKDFHAMVEPMDMEERAMVFEQVVGYLTVEHLRGDLLVEIVNLLFHIGVTALQAGNYKECMRRMKDCYHPLEEARRLSHGSESMQTEIRVLDADIYMHYAIAESIQARETGDRLLEHVLKEEENVNIDMVWEVIDWYKQAILLTRENEVEMEAIALSRLGSVFHKVLKLNWRAKNFFMVSVQLAASLHPRIFNQEDWYKEAAQTLEKFQREGRWEEETRWQRERRGHMDTLKDELADLRLHNNGDALEFMKHVYKTYPPKDKRHKMPEVAGQMNMQKKKKLLQKAIIHYHPDKVDVEKHGMKYKVLREEITKMFTQKYECMKF